MSKGIRKAWYIFVLAFLVLIMHSSKGDAATRLSKKRVTLRTGSAFTLSLEGANQQVEWNVSKSGIIQIVYKSSSSIIFKGKRPGTVKLSATTTSENYTCKIRVKKEIPFPKKKTLFQGDRFKVKAGEKGNWKLSKPGIISISKKTGKSNTVQALKAGKTSLIFRTRSKTYKCIIKVISPLDNASTEPSDVAENVLEESVLNDLFPDELVGRYAFGSGAGAWGSSLTLNKDGTFTAISNKTNNYDPGDGYQYSRAVGNCSGRFIIIKRVSPFCLEMKIEDYKDEIEQGTTWLQDNCKFLATGVIGLTYTEGYVFYLKGSPREILPESLKDGGIMINVTDGILKTNFIYNTNSGSTFTGGF